MSKRYSVTVTLTPRQAVAVDEAARHAALTLPWSERWRNSLFGAKSRVRAGLHDAGWREEGKGWTIP